MAPLGSLDPRLGRRVRHDVAVWERLTEHLREPRDAPPLSPRERDCWVDTAVRGVLATATAAAAATGTGHVGGGRRVWQMHRTVSARRVEVELS